MTVTAITVETVFVYTNNIDIFKATSVVISDPSVEIETTGKGLTRFYPADTKDIGVRILNLWENEAIGSLVAEIVVTNMTEDTQEISTIVMEYTVSGSPVYITLDFTLDSTITIAPGDSYTNPEFSDITRQTEFSDAEYAAATDEEISSITYDVAQEEEEP